MINYKFKIDIKGEKAKYTDLIFTTGDTKGIRLSFEFTDGTKQFDTEKMSLCIKGKRADGIVVTDSGVKGEGGVLFYDVKNSMTSVSGELSFEVALCDESGAFVTILELFAFVREGYGDADLKAYDTAPVLASLISQGVRVESYAQSAQRSAQNAENSVVEMKKTMDDCVKNFKRYPYRTVNFETAHPTLELFSNTVTLVCGESIENDGFSFELLYDNENNISQEIVLILDLSGYVSKQQIGFICREAGLKWMNGEPPMINEGKIYIFSFLLGNMGETNEKVWLGIGGGEFY